MSFLSCSSTCITIPSHCLVEDCERVALLYGLRDLCFIAEVFKKAICCKKGFLQNISIFEWLIVSTKDVTDATGSNSYGLILGSGVWWRFTAVLSAASCVFKSRIFVACKGVGQVNPSRSSRAMFWNAAPTEAGYGLRTGSWPTAIFTHAPLAVSGWIFSVSNGLRLT